MSTIPTPTHCNYQKLRKTSVLGFDDKAMSGEYYMRGGICWPTTASPSAGAAFQGYAVMLGENVKTKKAYVFEEVLFFTVMHIPREDGGIQTKGLCSWLTENWSRYYARDYYIYHPNVTHRTHNRYANEIWEHRKFICPQPLFSSANWTEDEQAVRTVYLRLQMDRLFYRKTDGDQDSVYSAVLQQSANPNHKTPALMALMAVVNGLEQDPWNRQDKEYASAW